MISLPEEQNYPSELHIGDETYKIVFRSRVAKSRRNLGMCDDGKKIIYLKRRQSKNMLFRTLVHEVIHAMECEYNIKIPHEVVQLFEKAIGDFLMVNVFGKV